MDVVKKNKRPKSLAKQIKQSARMAVGLPKKKPPVPEWRKRDYFIRATQREILGIKDQRCFVLQNVIRSLKDVEGDVAECGVRFGRSTSFLLEADLSKRRYCLFDSFEGLSEPSPEDFLAHKGRSHWEKADMTAPEDITRNNLAGFDNLEFYKGWIPDRFAEVAGRRFALVHVDVDLYTPTVQTLEFFWPLVAPGGIVVCDDYGSRKCPGSKRAFDEFFADGKGRLMELPTMQALVFKPG